MISNEVFNTPISDKVKPVVQIRETKTEVDEEKDQSRMYPETAPKEIKTETIDLEKLVDNIKKHVDEFSTKISFSYDPDKQESKIIVTDKATGKIIREIPPEHIVDLVEQMSELSGVIFDGRA